MRCMVLALLVGCSNSTQSSAVGDVRVETIRRAFANTHVVDMAEGTILVDPGSEEGAADMEEAVRDAGFDPGELRAIVLTHGHADHAGAALHFRDAFGTPIVGGAGDRALFEAGENDELCPTNSFARNMLEANQTSTYTPYLPDLLVDAPTTLEAYGLPAVEVDPLPGHTEGSLVVRAGGAVFAGDTLRGSVLGSAARLHYYICDETDNRQDVVQMMDDAPAGEVFFVGHFGPLARDAVEAWLEE